MDCVNHSGIAAAAYCQNCGKGLCADCIAAGAMRNSPSGQILCDVCISAWHSVQPPFAGLQPQGPNPTAAAALGLIPGVGAMYNGQFFKGFIHVVVFVALVSITDRYGLFGIFIGAWVLYQAFEAYHTARAMREGLPIPDPLGLNEVGNWLNLGGRPRGPWQPGTGPAPVNPGPSTSAPAGSTGQSPADPAASGGFQPPHPAGAYGNPWQPQPSYPPYPPTPPCGWRRREPIGAIVLIALGVLFLMGQMNFFSEVMKFAWPLGLIALGVWLIVNQVGNSQGGSK